MCVNRKEKIKYSALMATVGIGSKSPMTKSPVTKAPMTKSPSDKIPHEKIPHDRIPHVKIPRAGPNIRQTRMYVRYYIRVRALLY